MRTLTASVISASTVAVTLTGSAVVQVGTAHTAQAAAALDSVYIAKWIWFPGLGPQCGLSRHAPSVKAIQAILWADARLELGDIDGDYWKKTASAVDLMQTSQRWNGRTNNDRRGCTEYWTYYNLEHSPQMRDYGYLPRQAYAVHTWKYAGAVTNRNIVFYSDEMNTEWFMVNPRTGALEVIYDAAGSPHWPYFG